MTLFDPAEVQSEPTGPAGPTERIRLVVAYDGSGFHGFAVNEGVRTVGGTLAAALGTVLGCEVDITCAGRTDKGVHARAQVVTFDVERGLAELPSLMRSVNKMCGPAIAVTAADVVSDDFDARFSAQARRYRYKIVNRPAPDPFQAHLAWHVAETLHLPALQLACDPFIGEHDFAAFCRRPKRRDSEPASLVRKVTEATWYDDGGGDLRFEIEASAFCHQMVRSIVGTMVDAGRGRLHPGDIMGIIRSGDRNRAGDLAPPQGLTLWNVRYPGWSSGD
ncbi:MAG: tRNA pseudouridine(38-40) synthase TruA [Acidimicrobiales bacterium]|nr:tRNA pseudouridine(38-40) synthase TruA [Acidimicrobiales bacterium]